MKELLEQRCRGRNECVLRWGSRRMTVMPKYEFTLCVSHCCRFLPIELVFCWRRDMKQGSNKHTMPRGYDEGQAGCWDGEWGLWFLKPSLIHCSVRTTLLEAEQMGLPLFCRYGTLNIEAMHRRTKSSALSPPAHSPTALVGN